MGAVEEGLIEGGVVQGVALGQHALGVDASSEGEARPALLPGHFACRGDQAQLRVSAANHEAFVLERMEDRLRHLLRVVRLEVTGL